MGEKKNWINTCSWSCEGLSCWI